MSLLVHDALGGVSAASAFALAAAAVGIVVIAAALRSLAQERDVESEVYATIAERRARAARERRA